MIDTRKKDTNWGLRVTPTGVETVEQAILAVLMDLRDELKRMNAVLNCYNALDIPNILRRIQKNTIKPKRKRKAA